MLPKLLLLCCLCLGVVANAQESKLYGKITNSRLEPLALVSVQVKDSRFGTLSDQDGNYQLNLEPGNYDIVVSMIGYKSKVLTVSVSAKPYQQNIILEDDASRGLAEVVVKGKSKDRSEEIITRVIRQKEKILEQPGPYSCDVYVKAVQEDSSRRKAGPKRLPDSLIRRDPNADLQRMSMAEIMLRLDWVSFNRLKEERLGMTKRGNIESLFFLSVTEGDFNIYNNLIKAPAISQVPFVSPISYSGLLAYRFKMLRIETRGNQKVYVIGVHPRQLSNATVEGEVSIADSLWVVLDAKFRLPSYHLPEYDFFEVQQQYKLVNDQAWLIRRQTFTYYSKNNRNKKSGKTIAAYSNYELNKTFAKGYFGSEVSAVAASAFDQDSSFWNSARPEPLSAKEIRFIAYKDSVFRATHTKAYLDSLDRKINKLTWRNVLLMGQNLNNHEKGTSWYFPALPSLYQPFSFGGSRISVSLYYSKIYKSRKTLSIRPSLSYGLRNHDVNGEITIGRMYNPFNRGYYSISAGRRFEYIFEGDAWINMLKRNNVYLNNSIGVNHGLELVNGLRLETGFEIAIRRSVSNYKTNSQVDSLFGSVLDDNRAVSFPGYNALYADSRLAYTPFQRYIREPREKIILGSSWPTFYVQLKKGIPSLMKSTIDFDYLEFGLNQDIKLGLAGISTYTLKTGDYLNRRDLRLVDYHFQRRGDPLLFMNPEQAFQSLDSTFPVFQRYYQGHFIHHFNGFIVNKIPLFKKLRLREIAGAGFLIAPERNLRYMEVFAGVERPFNWPFDPQVKFKVGVYVVSSLANQFRNPVQFKIGITSWDRRRNRWF